MSAIVSIGTPTRPTSPDRHRVVAVVAHLGRQVEGDREAGLAAGKQVAEALVRLLGGAEAGVLAHRPGPAPYPLAVDAAGEGIGPRLAERLGVAARRGRPGR